MIIAGILLLLLGLGLFISAGIKLDDEPGLEQKTVAVMALGLISIIAGGIMLYGKVFGGW